MLWVPSGSISCSSLHPCYNSRRSWWSDQSDISLKEDVRLDSTRVVPCSEALLLPCFCPPVNHVVMHALVVHSLSSVFPEAPMPLSNPLQPCCRLASSILPLLNLQPALINISNHRSFLVGAVSCSLALNYVLDFVLDYEFIWLSLASWLSV